MLKLSGAPKKTLDCAKNYRCPVCESKAPPDKPYLQKPRERPAGFNVEVHVDLKYAKNIKEETVVALSMVCAGTNKQSAVLLKTRKASYVAQKFIKHWISNFGRPQRIVMDQGGEFEREWILMLEQYGIHSTTTGSHAGWQHALAERHGALLGVCWHALVVDFQVVSRQDMAVSLAAAVDAKNETLTRQGYSPNMLVFGKCISYPELLADDDIDPVTQAQAMDVDCEMARRSKMRNQARQVLLRDDVQQKLKRALQRRPASQDHVYLPGQVIYFYIPNMKPRYRQDHGRWRGPAVVIIQESHQKYYVSWRGRCLLLAAPNMRPASQEESMAHSWVKEEMKDMAEGLSREDGQGKEFEDLSDQRAPEPPPPREVQPSQQREDNARRMMMGMRTVRKLMNVPRVGARKTQLGILDGRTREAKRLKAIEDGSVNTQRQEVVKIESEDSEEEPEPIEEIRSGEEAEEAAEDEIEDESRESKGESPDEESEFWRDLERQEIEADYEQIRTEEMRREASRRREVLEDFPREALKRKEQKSETGEEVAKRIKTDFYTLVMMAASQHDLPKRRKGQVDVERRCNSWLSRSELRSLRRLLQLPVKAARIHYAPRKRLQRPPNDKPRKRISVLLGEEPSMALLVQEEEEDMRRNPRRKAPFLWRGMTMFLEVEEKKEEPPMKEVYVEQGGKIYGTSWDPQKADVWHGFIREEEKKRQIYETFLLRMKQNGKELDPKFFDKDEMESFKEADRKEWQSWVDNGVMRLLTQEEAKKVDQRKVFRIPLRWVRVNKNKEVDYLSRLVAKSRLVVPGHADPGLGDFRSDAPTTNPISVRMIKVLAMSRKWTTKIFDVSTAFLSYQGTTHPEKCLYEHPKKVFHQQRQQRRSNPMLYFKS